MTEKYISSIHIQKLGHEILEIRERALSNLRSKLDHGFVYDNDLARSREVLTKLLEWFLLEPCTKQEQVFSLMKKILCSQSGKELINHFGTSSIKQELKRIRSYIEPKFYKNLDEIDEIIQFFQVNNVPLLETDVPLSYRTGDSIVGSTATTIEGLVTQDSSVLVRDQQSAVSSPKLPVDNTITALPWQVLIEPDRHVLHSIETNLRRPVDPSVLLHSAEFFRNVLLHDFPAEIFLQRPYLVLTFFELITSCPSTRIRNSMLNGLCSLTRHLQVRVNHHKDPSMASGKELVGNETSSGCSSPNSRQTASGQSDEETDKASRLQTFQISFPRFCYVGFKSVFKFLCAKPDNSNRKGNQKGVNLAIELLIELLALLGSVLHGNVWNSDLDEVIKQLNEVLIGFGVVLEHFRLEASSDDSNLNNRVKQLCLLQSCVNFLVKMVPKTQTGLVLPRNLKNALCNSLLDVSLAKLYPEMQIILLDYVQSFCLQKDSESLRKYYETKKVCESITSCIEFTKSSKTCNITEAVDLALKALPCLEFDKNLNFVHDIIDIAICKLPFHSNNEKLLETFESIVLKLLAHNVPEIQQETYVLCQKKVINAVGPRMTTGGNSEQICYLIRPKILVEIATQGLTASNPRVENAAADILIHILKSKVLISDELWCQFLESILISFPLLLPFTNKTTPFGRTLLDLTDPDTADAHLIPKIETLKSNILLLFTPEAQIREESFSRLVWLMATQENAKNLLPRLNNLQDKALPNVCQSNRLIDLNRNRPGQHFYQPSSLQQVFELLNEPNVEPVIRRSALTQISVMCEDSMLHSTFVDCGGIKVCLDVMKSAMVEQCYRDYPDSIIPVIGVLKNVCLYHARVRQELAGNADLFYNVLRGLFMFFPEEKLRQDAVTLLFLLIFADFIKGTPSKADLSIPHLIHEKLRVPFNCNTHWKTSPYCEPNLRELLASDRWCLSSLQIEWNLGYFGGISNLLQLKSIDYDEHKEVADELRLSSYDFECLKASSIEYCVKKYLILVQNASTHENVLAAIHNLTIYLHLYKMSSVKIDDFLVENQWEVTFSRFLKSMPSGEEDARLLSEVLHFLQLLVPFYKSLETPNWISKLLKEPKNHLLDLITLEQTSTEECKALSQDIQVLITLCVRNEHHYLDYYSISTSEKPLNWCYVIKIIANSLKFSDSTHFYNLAYLDALLSCLVHLTAVLGWTRCLKSETTPKKFLSQLVSNLCELIVVFHCGKGQTAAISVMGLSITRNVILILNHLIAEMKQTKLKNWEECFFDVDEEDWMKSFMILWTSRDVVLRAGAVQFFAGMTNSSRLAITVVNELKHEKDGIWHSAILLLVDEDEASVVRENCAFLLANLAGHTFRSLQGDQETIVTSLVPPSMKKDKDDVTTIFDLLDDYQFYKNLINTLNSLYTSCISNSMESMVENFTNLCSNRSSSTNKKLSTTPSLVKSCCVLLQNLNNLDSDRLNYKLQDCGLIKLIFRSVCDPTIEIDTTRTLSLYCEIMEMNIAIVSLLAQLVRRNTVCWGTVLHTKDCLNVLVSLLNPNCYHINLPQLVYLRNQLWSEIYKLLKNLINIEGETEQEEALFIILETINETGERHFFVTLCESLTCLNFDDLHMSALVLLASLLKTESKSLLKKSESTPKSANSVQNLLDTSRTYTIGQNNDAGSELCNILLNLYDLSSLKVPKVVEAKKSAIISALTILLYVSHEAKAFAFKNGLVDLTMKQMKALQSKLALESVDSLRKSTEKKRLSPILKDLNDLIGLIGNFMVDNDEIKTKFATDGFCDVIHKLWAWFIVPKSILVDVLQSLANITTENRHGCQALTLSSSLLGTNQRKTPTRVSLLHSIISLVEKEMDSITKSHNLNVLELCLVILTNSCIVLECRVILTKSTLLNAIVKLHPAMTKKQKVWEIVEGVWLAFLEVFSLYPEGQAAIAKSGDVFEIVLALCCGGNAGNREMAVLILRNLCFYTPNRARLLTSDDFLKVLRVKLDNGGPLERNCVVLMLWALASNNQKAKIVFKSAELDVRLEQVLRQYEIGDGILEPIEIEKARYVLKMIR